MDIDGKMLMIEINDELIIQFVGIPKGYTISSTKLDGHKTSKIGMLKSFNKLKRLEEIRKGDINLVEFFTELLRKNNWDFSKYPNPTAYFLIRN